MRPSLAVTCGGLAAVAASYLGVASGRTQPLDAALTAGVGRSGRRVGPGVDRTVGVVTDLGSVHALVGASGALCAAGRSGLGRRLLASGALAWALAQGLKPALERPRPYETGDADRLVSPPAGSSWPSGHAALATAGLCALWPALSPAARVVGSTVVAGVGASRLYVGVHHGTDVIAGMGVGALAAVVGVPLADRWPTRRASVRNVAARSAAVRSRGDGS